MPQINWLYNGSSLAEVADNVFELVDTTEESTILQFQNSTGNMSSINGSYDNIVNFTNNTKIGYASKGALAGIASKVFNAGVTTVSGVLVGVSIGFALQKACEAFGLQANWWGGASAIGDTLGYKVLNNIATRKGCNIDDLLASKVFGITTDGRTINVGKNFLEDVAEALADEGMVSSLQLPTADGVTHPSSDFTTGDISLQTAVYRAGSAMYANFMQHPEAYDDRRLEDFLSCYSKLDNLINKIQTEMTASHLTFAGAVSISYSGYFGGIALSVGILDWSYIPDFKYINVDGKIKIDGVSISAMTKEIVADGRIYDRSRFSIEPIIGMNVSYTPPYNVFSSVSSATYVTAGTLTVGYAGIDYIGDPLTGSALEQYPAWLAKALGLFMPLSLSDTATTQGEVQSGVIGNTLPYADIDPYDDVPPTDGTDEKPDPPDPSPAPSPTPIPPIPSFNANKLYTVHTITDQQLDVLGGYLWSSDFIALIEHMFTEPVSAVLGLQELHYGGNISVSGEEHIKLGAFDSGATGNRVTNRYVEFSCGSVNVAEYYKNVEDYDPYTTIQIFLPYIGYCSLDSKEVMDSVVEVKYGIDVYTGSCVARILVTKAGVTQELYNFYGQCGLQLPVTSADYSRLLASFASVGIGLASGNAPVAVAGGLGIIGGAGKINYGRTNGFNNNVGTMTSQKPFILIQRPVAFNATSYERFYGFPSNWTIKLSMCSGYTRVKDIHLDTVVCTDEERKEIEDLLKTGVIF